jgi:hypothetical protein
VAFVVSGLLDLHVVFVEGRLICGEGIYPRWGAKRPPDIWSRFVWKNVVALLGLLCSPAGMNPLATGHPLFIEGGIGKIDM